MSRFLTRFALSAGVCLSFASATLAAEQPTAALPLPSAGQARMIAALDQPTEFDFHELPLSDVIDYFKQKHEIEILLDSKAEFGASLTVIKQTLKRVTLRSALRLLLRPRALTYVVGDGYLLITKSDDAELKLSCKVYPVHDLVTLNSGFRPAPAKADAARSFPGLIAPVPRSRIGKRPDDAGDFSGLIDMIVATVAPETWDDVGGPGTITENPNAQVIAVSQTDEVHEQIALLLAALRRVRDAQLAAAAPLNAAVSPEAPGKEGPLQIHGYRFMPGPKPPGKSGWRPPLEIVGDSTPSRRAQERAKKSEAAAQASSASGGATPSPAKDAASTDEPVPAAEVADNGPPAKPADAKLEAWVEMIAKVVPELIEPESWTPSGEGTIRAVGEAIVLRNTDEIQRRVARLMAELMPDYVPIDFRGPWGPWQAALQVDHETVRLKPPTTGDWPHQAEPRPCGAEARAHEALLEKCDRQLDQVPLSDVLSELAELRHVQLYIDYKALSNASVDLGTPVSQSVKGLSYATALKLILDELDLTYLIRDEVLLITTKTEAANMLSIQVYPVFDLVVRPPDAPTSRPALDFQSLMNNIVTNLSPDTWDDVGGSGTVQPFTNSGALVIAQTSVVHQEIAEYLKALRAAAAQKQQPADADAPADSAPGHR